MVVIACVEPNVGLMVYDIFDLATGGVVENVAHGDITLVSFVDLMEAKENWTFDRVQTRNETVKESLSKDCDVSHA